MSDERRSAKETAEVKPEKEVKPVRAKRVRKWDETNKAGMAGYRIGAELKAVIEVLAAEHGVSSAEIARQFLQRSLEEYRAGRLKIK